MAARSPRRTFASPFVITLAAAVPATACHVDPRSGPATTNRDPATLAESPPGPTTASPADPPPPPPPPAPAPAEADTGWRWTVSMEGSACMASRDARCPPATRCNPPRPSATKCPPGITEDHPVIVRQLAGESTCFIEPAPIECPPDVMCNPPPPQKVDCPE